MPPSVPPFPPPLPPPFPGFVGWASTDVSGRVALYPTSRAGEVALQRFNRKCMQETGRLCVACADFGPRYQTSLSDPVACTDCGPGAVLTLILFGLLAVVSLLAVAVFVRLATRHPTAMRRWVSTCMLILNHA